VVTGEVHTLVETAEVIPVNSLIYVHRTLRIGIGNPSLRYRSVMLGIRIKITYQLGRAVWFNELRLAGLDNNGGWNTVAAIRCQRTDFLQMCPLTR
jgi:cell surface protein SprA